MKIITNFCRISSFALYFKFLFRMYIYVLIIAITLTWPTNPESAPKPYIATYLT